MFEKILLPLDFSEHTDEIMNAAVQIAQKFGSTIHLLHVIHPL
jgi:nucleotide-binding universal stress UspA family protein